MSSIEIVFSDEQKNIGDNLKENLNVTVLATAGAGKTTSIKYIYSLFDVGDIISMTFNKHLADESKQSIMTFAKKSDILFNTVHSLANILYSVPCPDNNGLYKIITNDIKPSRSLSHFKILIYDEAQDMNELFYKFLVKLIRDIGNKNLRICLLGDDKQCINQFTGATTQFILQSEKYFSNLVEGKWKHLQLTTTYRLSEPVANFINNVINNSRKCKVSINKQAITDKPDYIIADMFSPKFFEYIINIIDKYVGTQYEKVALVCKTVKSLSNPVHRFVNYLKHIRPHINIYRTKSDEELRDDKVTNSKMLISSVHQMKGQERDVIIYFLFDNSYYNINSTSKLPEPILECPNPIYVGLTRAKKHMILCHHYRNDFLPFINKEKLQEYANIHLMEPVKIMKNYKTELISSKNVTELVSYLDINITNELLTTYSCNDIILGLKPLLKFNNVLLQVEDLYEDLSSLIGQVIPILSKCKYYGIFYSDYLKENCSINEFEGSYNTKYIAQYKQIVKKAQIDIKDFIQALHIYFSYKEKYLHELYQLNGKYDWIYEDSRIYNICASRILDFQQSLWSDHTEKILNFEFPLSEKFAFEPFEITINGYIDCICEVNDKVYIIEYKCCEFKDSHILQLLVYGCLYYIIFEKQPILKLYYPLSDTLVNININNIKQNSEVIIKKLINNKINTECNLDNIHFTYGSLRGYTFKEVLELIQKDNLVLEEIQNLCLKSNHELLKKECITFMYYKRHN